MPTMYNPDTQETVEAAGEEVRQREQAGFVTVGNRPPAEYQGRSREDLLADGHHAGAVRPPAEDADPSPLPDADG